MIFERPAFWSYLYVRLRPMKVLLFFLSLSMITNAQTFEGDDYVEPVENYESYDEAPPEVTTYPAKPYPKKDFHVNSDEMPVEEYDEYAPVEGYQEAPPQEYQDYGVEADSFDAPSEYESYDSTDY